MSVTMPKYQDLLTRLDEAHVEEQTFNRETFGEREFDPEESSLYSEAAAAIRKLTEPPKPLEFGPLAIGSRVELLAETGYLKVGDIGTVTKFDKWVGEEWPYVVVRDDGREGAFARHELRKVQ